MKAEWQQVASRGSLSRGELLQEIHRRGPRDPRNPSLLTAPPATVGQAHGPSTHTEAHLHSHTSCSIFMLSVATEL